MKKYYKNQLKLKNNGKPEIRSVGTALGTAAMLESREIAKAQKQSFIIGDLKNPNEGVGVMKEAKTEMDFGSSGGEEENAECI